VLHKTQKTQFLLSHTDHNGVGLCHFPYNNPSLRHTNTLTHLPTSLCTADQERSPDFHPSVD